VRYRCKKFTFAISSPDEFLSTIASDEWQCRLSKCYPAKLWRRWKYRKTRLGLATSRSCVGVRWLCPQQGAGAKPMVFVWGRREAGSIFSARR